ncbi:MAG TPA: hypothetical protein VJM33_06760 [Microthrixaceae bacterium]|nr:hypothetical protein [Microthrixaceae bacterium]
MSQVIPPDDAQAAIARTHEWFHHHSGWAPPDEHTMSDWLAEDMCRAPDDCVTSPTGWCEHGLASWWLILDALVEGPGRP